MKRKTSNIIIGVLATVIVFCGVMAGGTFSGWFSGDEGTAVPKETVVQEGTTAVEETSAEAQEQVKEEQVKEQKQFVKPVSRCTITIKCDSILRQMDNLKEGKNRYVPSSGVILSKSTVEFNDGNSVYDVLKATCSAAGINLSAKNSSMGVYVEGINNIFEFDCGGTSGWLYSVNGTSPNHSCSEEKIKNGDNIVWYYSCGE